MSKFRCFALFATFLIFASSESVLARDPGEVVGFMEERLFAFFGATIEEARDSRTIATPLGSATADAARLVSGADFAIINGGDFFLNLPNGYLTWNQVYNVFTENRELALATITPMHLMTLLEASIGHIELRPDESIIRQDAHGAFPQISGLTFTFDVSAATGSRLVAVFVDSGIELNPLDDTTEFSLVATSYMLGGGYNMPAISHMDIGITLADALAYSISSGIDISHQDAVERITTIGSRDNRFFAAIPRDIVFFVSIVFIVIILLFGAKQRQPSYKEVFNFLVAGRKKVDCNDVDE